MSVRTLEQIKTRYTDIYDPECQAELLDLIRNNNEMAEGQVRQYSTSDIIGAIIFIDRDRRARHYGQWKRLRGDKASKFEWSDPRQADGVPIFARQTANVVKINHKSHTPFDRIIATQKSSYLTSTPPNITPVEENADMTALEEWIDRRNYFTLLNELAQDSASLGEAFTLYYSPMGTNDVYVTKELSYNCVILYDTATGEREYGLIYFRLANENYVAFWYNKFQYTKYEGVDYESMVQVGESELHSFSDVPLIGWRNNTERISENEPILNLMDMYDIVDSDFITEISQTRFSYFVLKGFGLARKNANDKTAASDLANQIVQTGAFVTENENAVAEYVTKSIAYEAVDLAKKSLRQRIFLNSIDPSELKSVQGDTTNYQIEQMFFTLEQSTKETEAWFKRAFYESMDLIREHQAAFNNVTIPEVVISYKRTKPENMAQDIINARAGGFMIAQDILAEMQPFGIDQARNRELLAKEANSMLVNPIVETNG
jgi:SPP1 family phage portal protein